MTALYEEFIAPGLKEKLLEESKDYAGVPGLKSIGPSGGLETRESLAFAVEIFKDTKEELYKVLKQRIEDRNFIDLRTSALAKYNLENKISVDLEFYRTVLGLQDSDGRVVVGPLKKNYWYHSEEAPVAELPDYLKGPHVTLFGPPDNPKMCINAMNAFHRRLKDEPPVVAELLKKSTIAPKWGADDEDSKTPLRSDLISAGMNLKACFDGTLHFSEANKNYELQKSKLSLPIKRFPGLALPALFLFYNEEAFPLHLYDFALHLFANWSRPEALVFYVPKLENEEEARYIKNMIASAESKIQRLNPEYRLGTVRLMIVLENPRAVFRTHEIMDELYPYFAGASLGWHDYLASTARLFKEDSNYRIPVKADPDIVIKYIKASHELLSRVVGLRGGIKVGGMYGILPIGTDLFSDSFQLTLKGYFRDVFTQLKRNLTGFWVAHPDFVRIGIAMVEAWKLHSKGQSESLHMLIDGLMLEKYRKELKDFILGDDIASLDPTDPRYARSLIVADLKGSELRPNHDFEEIRYNVFQILQYLADWLSGNGCVALPAEINGQAVRVMDDLATCERSRWEVWHEIFHKRVPLEDFLLICFEEMNFIRKDLSNTKKIVQVKWNEKTSSLYEVAFQLMILLMTKQKPVEFVSELLLPFTVSPFQPSLECLDQLKKIDPDRFGLESEVERFLMFFDMCGHKDWASGLAKKTIVSESQARELILNFGKSDVIEAARFHGNIGESARILDFQARSEQRLVSQNTLEVQERLLKKGQQYLEKFGFKFLISAAGKTAEELERVLDKRLEGNPQDELELARQALWEIALKRSQQKRAFDLERTLAQSFNASGINGAQVSLSRSFGQIENICLGQSDKKNLVKTSTFFEMASLSKVIASAFCIEFFKSKNIDLKTSVKKLLREHSSPFVLEAEDPKNEAWTELLQLCHLMNHEALNAHYVLGYDLNKPIPPVLESLNGVASKHSPKIRIKNKPGTQFSYSGGGFLLLEHIVELLSGHSARSLAEEFCKKLGCSNIQFYQYSKDNLSYASGFKDNGEVIEGSRFQFPAFAAGALSSANEYLKFLQTLAEAYSNPHDHNVLSHDTAVQMLQGFDNGSVDFMNAKMGLGVFVLEGGPNKWILHQGANDGFRALALYCFRGPNFGKGLVSFANAELKAVSWIGAIVQKVLQEWKVEGVDLSFSKSALNVQGIKEEEKVNQGYKQLLFSSFIKPEAEKEKGLNVFSPRSNYNRLVGAKILSCSNDAFAPADNLISGFEPIFDVKSYGCQGKIMDSWESARHSPRGFEDLTLEMPSPTNCLFVEVSTKFHKGNHVPAFSLEAKKAREDVWTEILPRTNLEGHSLLKIKLAPAFVGPWKFLRVVTYPDGGLTRLAVYDESLPLAEKEDFFEVNEARCVSFKDEIPVPKKSLSLPLNFTDLELEHRKNGRKGENLKNLSDFSLGAKVLYCSNEHYGPSYQVLSPFRPLNMFDGFESARSRVSGHQELLHIKLSEAAVVDRIDFDFKFFINNSPRALALEFLVDGNWLKHGAPIDVKAFAGNYKSVPITYKGKMTELKIHVIPDGGIHRIHVWGRAS